MIFNIYLLTILSVLLSTNSNHAASEVTKCTPTNLPNQHCKCHLVRAEEKIICQQINSTNDFCLVFSANTTQYSVTSLSIQSSELPDLALTYGIIDRLGIDLKTFKRLQITQGGLLENVNICSIHQEFISSQDRCNATLKCQDLGELQELDLRDNKNLSTLDEFDLPKLQKLYLSGIYFCKHCGRFST